MFLDRDWRLWISNISRHGRSIGIKARNLKFGQDGRVVGKPLLKTSSAVCWIADPPPPQVGIGERHFSASKQHVSNLAPPTHDGENRDCGSRGERRYNAGDRD